MGEGGVREREKEIKIERERERERERSTGREELANSVNNAGVSASSCWLVNRSWVTSTLYILKTIQKIFKKAIKYFYYD